MTRIIKPQKPKRELADILRKDISDYRNAYPLSLEPLDSFCYDSWSDLQLFFVSFSSVYRILCSEGLMSMRGAHRHHNGRSLPPTRKEITGPNQRWCWDISYLRTYERSVFLYLYLLLDEYSRKAIHWLISWRQRAEDAQQLI